MSITDESPSIVATSLAVGYGHRPVVDGVGFTLFPGQMLVLIGTNGSGKSTLLKTLAGLLDAQGGELSVLGEKPSTQPSRVAYLPQHPVSSHTLPLRVEDVVTMGRFARRGLFGRLNGDDRRMVSQNAPIWHRFLHAAPKCCCLTSRLRVSTLRDAGLSQNSSKRSGRGE
ncbi:MAG: ATP-binding cassette domain-containing protein [Actinobacteria bacterium]|nr:ATP-binding cassette domain-containing protein [Actinomycetota bacterium]